MSVNIFRNRILPRNQIFYRALKLDNIFLSEDGHIKICDFGLRKENTEFSAYTYIHLPWYLDAMAPEIIKKQRLH